MKKYDLVVVGSGAGLMVAEVAMQIGVKCALIEKDKFGGTCLTKGCIPSKMLVYPADLVREAERADRVGVKLSKPRIDWERIQERMWKQINYTYRIEDNLDKTPEIDVYKGVAEFASPHTLVVKDASGNTEEIYADRIVVSAGARSFVPDVDGLEEAGYVTYETFFGEKFPKKLWKSVTILGGGIISAEFAHILSAFGVEVTIIARSGILRHEEPEIREFVKRQFEKHGIKILSNKDLMSVEKTKKGKSVTFKDRESGEISLVESEELFIAMGLRSNSDILKVEKAGIEVDEKGWIVTNDYLETNVSHIYAIGDINGKYQFRHKANHEAEVLITNLFGREKRKANYNAVPWTIFTHPQVSHVGLTEAEVKEKGVECVTAFNYYSEVVGGISRGYSDKSDDNGFVKVIVSKDRRILGVHAVGPHSSMLVQPFVYVMNSNDGTYDVVSESMVIHPSLSELSAWVFEKIDLW